MEGVKRKRRCEDECEDHVFSLEGAKCGVAKFDIRLMFCPKYQREPMPPEFIHPQFNEDRKYYTSAFILGVDRRVLVKNEQQEIMDHQKQVRDSLQKHNQLVFPRPNSKHSHCSVCKDHYRNYYAHIATDDHRTRIANSPYNAHIHALAAPYEHLWMGAQERADEEAERRAAEEEERRQQRMAELTVREEEQEEEEESLLDVQRGEDEEEEDEEEEGEEYRAKENKKSHHRHYNDDTVPLQRSCKRPAPTPRPQSEYLRKKHLLTATITAERIQKDREERRYEREREKLKTDRDLQPVREYYRVAEREGDAFVIIKVAYSQQPVLAPAPVPVIQPQTPTAPTPPMQPPTALPTPTQTKPEFVWKRMEKTLRREEREREAKDSEVEKWERAERTVGSGWAHGNPERIEKENRKYQIYYEEREFNRDDFDEPYDARFPYYPYPPYYKDSIAPEIYKPEPHAFKTDPRQSFDPKPYEPYKSGYYPPIPNPQDHYRREAQFYHKEKPEHYGLKEKGKVGEKSYDHPQPYHWPYPPCYPHESIPKPTATTSSYPGNTNISINFPMYMCPPPPPYPPRYPPYNYPYPHAPPAAPYQYPHQYEPSPQPPPQYPQSYPPYPPPYHYPPQYPKKPSKF